MWTFTYIWIVIDIAFGHNVWDVSFDNITLSLKLFWIADLFYTALISLTKISMCFFFLRIFSHSRPFRRFVYGVITLNAMICVTFTFAVLFQCVPIYFFWTSWTGESSDYRCIDLYPAALSQGIISIIMDVAMISLPIHETTKLKLSTRKKLGVLVLFGMGFV